MGQYDAGAVGSVALEGTKPLFPVCMAMNSSLDLELIFPIPDRPSALFMGAKADCLYEAGAINERQRQWVRAKISAVVDTDRKAA